MLREGRKKMKVPLFDGGEKDTRLLTTRAKRRSNTHHINIYVKYSTYSIYEGNCLDLHDDISLLFDFIFFFFFFSNIFSD
jgi:hypothetical protein